ncbi:MAG TPA: alpha/beta hydrolase-fold protein [Chitinophagaceae bacterium]|nr:alpha/beta hydrolase-fold protein [Chitinophagaceae bacterium]
MKKTLCFNLYILILAYAAYSQSSIKWNVDTIHSKVLNEERFIWIKLPAGIDLSNKIRKYRVAFILDAEALFYTSNEVVEKINKEKNTGIIDWIFIGIDNIWLRDRDYTTSYVKPSVHVDSNAAAVSGGAVHFTKFLEKELLPFINSKYPVSTERIFIGHSLGGLFTINILFNHPGLFSHYVAIDPSMWWDDMKLLKDIQRQGVSSLSKKSLFLAVANTKEKNMTENQIRSDNSNKTILTRPGLRLHDFMKTNNNVEFKYNYKFYKDREHMSVYPDALYDAIRFVSGQTH